MVSEAPALSGFGQQDLMVQGQKLRGFDAEELWLSLLWFCVCGRRGVYSGVCVEGGGTIILGVLVLGSS